LTVVVDACVTAGTAERVLFAAIGITHPDQPRYSALRVDTQTEPLRVGGEFGRTRRRQLRDALRRPAVERVLPKPQQGFVIERYVVRPDGLDLRVSLEASAGFHTGSFSQPDATA
jgi:hypothetical protein